MLHGMILNASHQYVHEMAAHAYQKVQKEYLESSAPAYRLLRGSSTGLCVPFPILAHQEWHSCQNCIESSRYRDDAAPPKKDCPQDGNWSLTYLKIFGGKLVTSR